MTLDLSKLKKINIFLNYLLNSSFEASTSATRSIKSRISSFKEAARPATACNFVMVLNLVPLQVMPQELTAWNFSTLCSDASGAASGASSGAASRR